MDDKIKQVCRYDDREMEDLFKMNEKSLPLKEYFDDDKEVFEEINGINPTTISSITTVKGSKNKPQLKSEFITYDVDLTIDKDQQENITKTYQNLLNESMKALEFPDLTVFEQSSLNSDFNGYLFATMIKEKICFHAEECKSNIIGKLEKFFKRVQFQFYLIEFKTRSILKSMYEEFERHSTELENNYTKTLDLKVKQYEFKLKNIHEKHEEYVTSLRDELASRDQYLKEILGQREPIVFEHTLKVLRLAPQQGVNKVSYSLTFKGGEWNNKVVFDLNEFKSIQQLLYTYMTGKEKRTLSKVITSCLKFPQKMSDEIIQFNSL